MKSFEHPISHSDGDHRGYEAGDEDSECSSAPEIPPPHVTYTFSEPEVPGILLTNDAHLISSDPNNNNNRSTLDQGRGAKRKLYENSFETHTPKRQKTYHLYGGHVRGVKRKFQGDYSEQVSKRLKPSPEENMETWTFDKKPLLLGSSHRTESSSELNIAGSSASFPSVLSSVTSDNSSNRNAPYKNNKTENEAKNNISENEATSCPSSCVCHAGCSEQPESIVRTFVTAVPLYKSLLTRNVHSLSNMQSTCCQSCCMRKYPREEVERSCLLYMNGDYNGSDTLNREHLHWGWWKA